jgi:hypothetical protein
MGTVPENHSANQAHSSDDQLLVGVAAMAAEAKIPVRQMSHWVSTGLVKSAQKRGHLWTAGRRKFRRELGLD